MTRMTAPDVKALVMAALAAGLDCPVVSRRPDNGEAPARFVRVIDTGGTGRADRILTVGQVTVDSYAASTGQARDLAATVEAIICDLPATTVPVANVTCTSPAELPDPDTGQARYTATYQITTRLTE
ncbi:hypothetical protein [Actinomyces sp. MRS3W]|uniref:tail completion protein gp17 n=1 Tax=Actinomyces sp. MRS3W TaxID=2800796 RepID=UPI0028FD7A5B|nr:hypothetical protein [Actinomyces sp. MRS3W]MDU0349233.1 hypothetical protein [Actinomyces sp. MRS3W]